jgi:hypothetical protein
VVPSFEFALHPLGPEVAVAQSVYAYDELETVLRAWRDQAMAAPETVSPEAMIWSIPPDPEIPAELHGTKALFAVGVYAGEPRDAAPVLEPFNELGTPMLDLGGRVSYAELQSSVDELIPDGGRYYFKAQFLDELSDEAIATIVACDAERATPESLIAIRTLGGAIDRVTRDESAYPHRGARFNVSIDASWTDPADDDRVIGWARSTWDALRPFATGGVYVNFAGFDSEHDVSEIAVLGDSTARLDRVRAQYDPDGLFAGAAARR